jgi:hypothetical protein
MELGAILTTLTGGLFACHTQWLISYFTALQVRNQTLC